MKYDVIVVGAGPAGSTAARECADRGLSVVLLEKETFPRDKPCGGGVTVSAANLLPFDLKPVADRTIFGLNLSHKQSEGFHRRSPNEILYLTQRSKLDTYLAEQAIKSGVRLVEKAHVTQIDRSGNTVVVRTSYDEYQGTILVAADGANGRTADMVGIDRNLTRGIAIEGNITPTGSFPSEWNDTVAINVGTVAGGYGWLFPKSDHLNIGIGGYLHAGPNIRQRLFDLVRRYRFDPNELWGVRGYHLPVRRGCSPMVDGNVLLVGDAGGLLDPLTGEGIYAALWSGIAAARNIASYLADKTPDLKGYQDEIDNVLMPNLRLSTRFQEIFNLSPALFVAAEKRTGLIWKSTVGILRGEQTYEAIMNRHRALATAVDLVSDLIRVTPMLQRYIGLKEPAKPQRFFTGN